MCTVVVMRRPGHAWPLLIGANRDEMQDRPWRAPGRHWPDRPEVIAGRDELAGGTWLGMNDAGVVAAVMNRAGSLGPAPGKRSRGELVLRALEHAKAQDAAQALARLPATAWRSCNLLVADAQTALWLRFAHDEDGSAVQVREVPPGVSMLTSRELDDTRSARIRDYLPRFRAATAPEPGEGTWSSWEALLAERRAGEDVRNESAMNVQTDIGFGTVCSSLIALPSPSHLPAGRIWRFAAGAPHAVPFEDALAAAAV